MSDTATKDQKTTPAVEMVSLTIDGRPISVKKGATVLDACRQENIPVPTFCWHPKLRSVGACRMCYVEIEKFPKLMVSCATEAMNDMVVLTDSEKCREGRKAIIEFILLDHPLDCPTCDKGGECDLQDNAFEYGLSDDTRFAFRKARKIRDKNSTFDDLQIGPEMVRNQNRCILCYKCVRANEEAFGEYDIGAYQRGHNTEIDAAPGGQVASLYSGNLVEICPVGALTSSDWRYKIRVWNTQTVPSIDPYHADGANLTLWKDATKVHRATSRMNDDTDDGWISDIARYGYQIATSERRIKAPLVNKNGAMVEVSWEEALGVISRRFKEVKESQGAPCLAGVVSPNLDLKTLHAFNKLFRGALGSNNVDYRSDYSNLPTDADSTYGFMASRSFSIDAVASSDVIFVVGSNLIREHPNVHLKTRRAIFEKLSWLYTANPIVTKSADCSTDEMIYNLGTDEVFLNGVTLSLIQQGLADKEVDTGKIETLLIPNTLEKCAETCGVSVERINECAKRLANSKSPTLIAGELVSNSIARENIAKSFYNVALLLGIVQGKRGQAAVLAKAANSKGAEALGLFPEISATQTATLKNQFQSFPELAGANWDAMLSGAQGEDIKAMLIFGANPVQTGADYNHIKKSLESLDFLVVADLKETPTTALADVVLPLSSFAEYDGSFTNLEGRTQDFCAGMKRIGASLPGYEALNRIAQSLGFSLYADLSSLQDEVSELLDSYNAPERKHFLMESHFQAPPAPQENSLPLFAGDALHHFGHWTEMCHSLLEFNPEAALEISADLASRLDIQTGDSVRVLCDRGDKGNKGEKLILKALVSDILEGDTLLASHNFAAKPVNCFTSRDSRVSYVRIEKIEKQ